MRQDHYEVLLWLIIFGVNLPLGFERHQSKKQSFSDKILFFMVKNSQFTILTQLNTCESLKSMNIFLKYNP